MKLHLVLSFFTLSLLLVTPSTVLAQEQHLSEEDEMRGIKPNFDAKKVDGIKIRIRKAVNPKLEEPTFSPADPNQIFKSGDKIQFEFESNFTGYLYLLNITPSGQKTVIFPVLKRSNKIIASRPYIFPGEKENFEFDEDTGTERVQVLLTRNLIPFMDEAVGAREGRLTTPKGKSAPAATAETGIVAGAFNLESGDFEPRGVLLAKESNGATIVAVKRRPSSGATAAPKKPASSTIRTREVIISKGTAPPKPAPPIEAGKTSNNTALSNSPVTDDEQLGDKEVLMFEIRLKHQ